MRLHDYFDFYAREYPSTEFASQEGRTLLYGEAQAEVNRLANALVAAGLDQGDRVAILSKNSIEYVLLYLACSKAGVILVPLNYRLAPPEWGFILNDARARLLFTTGEYTKAVDGIRGELGGLHTCIVVGSAGEANWEAYSHFIEGQPSSPPSRRVSPEDEVYQMYTSGTTGHPKGVVLTHQGVTSNVAQLFQGTMPILHPQPGERWLLVAPVYHAAAAITAFSAIAWGGALFIMADFNPVEVVRALSEERIIEATLVPAMIQALLVTVLDVAQRNYEHLRLIGYGASPIAEGTLRRAIETFGCAFLQGYGMTETTAVFTVLQPLDHRRALSEKPELLVSAGRPVVGAEVQIVDEADNPLSAGETGEIVVRGPQVMRGYWRLPEATNDALRNGWMHTGDAGYMDDEGYVYVQDRIKDMIVSGGENIYPREVEEILFQHAAIADAAVIGVPDARWGEMVKAIVVQRSGHVVSAEEIIEFCRGKLGGYKLPRSVDFVAGLPRNASGKVLKRELREPYWAGQSRRVGG
jgi:acyl-CoA synthetase (AMP-forming)/AMP-acid ligase II